MQAELMNNRINPDLNWKMWDVVNNSGDWDTMKQMERVISFRSGLANTINGATDAEYTKDLLYLDLSMEFYQRQLVEKIIHLDIGKDNLFKEAYILLEGLLLSYKWDEFQIAIDEFKARGCDTNSCDNNFYAALKVKASLDRIKRCIGEVVERSLEIFQDKAVMLGTACKCDPHCVEIFTEEIIRGSLFFALSMVIKKLEPIVRRTLGSQLWLTISPIPKVSGRVIFSKSLKSYEENPEELATIIVTEHIGGEEEIPAGVTGVLLVKNSDYPDVLAHVSVRARNDKVLLAVCLEMDGPNVNKIFDTVNNYAVVEIKGDHIDRKSVV